MKQSNAGFTGNSQGSLGWASPEDLKKGFSVVKDTDDDDELNIPSLMRGWGRFRDYNPEPDSSIDRDSDTKDNWE